VEKMKLSDPIVKLETEVMTLVPSDIAPKGEQAMCAHTP